jgi:hypothetical protein
MPSRSSETKAVKTCQISRIEWMAEFIGLISDLSCVEPVKELTWAKGQCFTLIVCCCSFFYRCCSCYPLWFGLLVPECMWAPAITKTLSFTSVQVFKAKLVSLVLSAHCWLGYVHFFLREDLAMSLVWVHELEDTTGIWAWAHNFLNMMRVTGKIWSWIWVYLHIGTTVSTLLHLSLQGKLPC